MNWCHQLTKVVRATGTPLKVCVAKMAVNISDMRKPYKGETDTFSEDDLRVKEPFGQFEAWFKEACNTEGIIEANAMALATATKDGKPSVRMVLMKGYDKTGFTFFTNYASRKAKELDGNPSASIMFFWEPLMRVVRVEGKVERLSFEESTEYFHSRPKSSQIGACVSNQSQPVESRKVLEERNAELTKIYAEEEVPMPANWGGYILKPEVFEFWQGQTNRIHDRIVFRKPLEGDDPNLTKQGEDGWVYERLQP